MKTLRDVQTRAHGFLAEILRTIADRRKIVADRPEAAAVLEPRIAELERLAAFLHDLTFITYAEGDPPETTPTHAPRP